MSWETHFFIFKVKIRSIFIFLKSIFDLLNKFQIGSPSLIQSCVQVVDRSLNRLVSVAPLRPLRTGT